jgi:hypothetical protein
VRAEHARGLHAEILGSPGAAAGTYSRVITIAAPSVSATTVFRAIVPVAGVVAA